MSNWVIFDPTKESPPALGGCYVVYVDGQLEYIGSSIDLRSRFESHTFPILETGSISTPWGVAQEVRVKYRMAKFYGEWATLELRLIQRLKPRKNIQHVATPSTPKTKLLPWLKLWAEMPTDYKIRQLTVVEKWLWVACLCIARRNPYSPEMWIEDQAGSDKWRPATIADITKLSKITEEYWRPVDEVNFAGHLREWYTKREFLVYQGIEHFKKLDMVIESSDKRLVIKNFQKRQNVEVTSKVPDQDIPPSRRKKNRGIEEKKSRGKKKRKRVAPGSAKGEENQAVHEVYEYWLKVFEKPRSMLTKERRSKITARLNEGYSVEDMKKGIDGCKSSEFHMGSNERNTVYNELTLICRTGSKLEQFISFLNRQGGGLKHEHGKPSNRFVAKDQSGQGDDQGAKKRLEQLRAFSRGEVSPVPDGSEAEGDQAGSTGGEGA